MGLFDRVMDPALTQTAPDEAALSPERAALVPLSFAVLLAAFVLLPRIGSDPGLVATFLFAAACLAGWTISLYVRTRRVGPQLSMVVAIRRHHWVQACAQLVIYYWWGRYVPAVFDFAPLIAAQIVFAYGIDSLLSWSRRARYSLGFGPFPIILSINLFLWFKQDWFHWQFVLVLVGYLAKDLIRWTKNGRSAHIFNPSSFPLGVASLILIATGLTDITWGLEIAQTQNNPPYIFAVIFMAALPGMLLFGVTTMTMTAVITAYTFGLVYHGVTGIYYFYDAYIPIAVFLGMHLLFTDPSTSPRTTSGRVIFGVLYGMGTIGLVIVLDAVGAPTFYDKLLPVPILNLMVRAIDGWGPAIAQRLPDLTGPLASLSAAGRRAATVGIWVLVFVGISGAGGLGDHHPGQYLPFWEEACEAGSDRACGHAEEMESTYCERGSGWACNELGIRFATRDPDLNAARATLQRGCELGFASACANGSRVATGGPFETGPPPLEELPIVIRGSKGAVTERDPAALRALACERGWTEQCDAGAAE